MAPRDIRAFGPFEFDPASGELRKHGLRVRLLEQPRTLLQLLLEQRGEIVTREDVRQHLWPADTHVDFDAGLSSVMRKLRDALGDSAEQPRFVETVPRRGYRFIAQVTTPAAGDQTAAVASPSTAARSAPSRWMFAPW